MKLIAEDAQVSIATVSRVLNGKDSTSTEIRERVMRSVEKLGYKPNMIARSLRMRKSFVLGLIIPNITIPSPIYVSLFWRRDCILKGVFPMKLLVFVKVDRVVPELPPCWKDYEGGRHDISLGLIAETEAMSFSGMLWSPEIQKTQS